MVMQITSSIQKQADEKATLLKAQLEKRKRNRKEQKVPQPKAECPENVLKQEKPIVSPPKQDKRPPKHKFPKAYGNCQTIGDAITNPDQPSSQQCSETEAKSETKITSHDKENSEENVPVLLVPEPSENSVSI